MNIVEFLEARIAEDEAAEARKYRDKPGALDGYTTYHEGGEIGIARTGSGERPVFMSGKEFTERFCEPAPNTRVLAECAAKRTLLSLASGWDHEYNDDDTWYSCGLATSYYSDEPGSGCADDSKHGRCTCGLVERQSIILSPLAAVYADHPDYQEEWRHA